MNYQTLLRNIPENKLEIAYKELEEKFDDINIINLYKKAYKRYFDANIPVSYWKLGMGSDFNGDPNLLEIYKELATEIPKTYREGKIICFCGSYGRGKTLAVCNILKKAVETGYTALYTTLNDIISLASSSNFSIVRRELLTVHFCILDEFDSRWFSQTSNSTGFFGRVLEDILRSRMQNNLPLYLCSNSTNPIESFTDDLKESIGSLWHYVNIVPVLGKDYRKNIKINVKN